MLNGMRVCFFFMVVLALDGRGHKIKDIAWHCAHNVLISAYFNLALIKKLTKSYVGITAHLPMKVCDQNLL